MYTKKERIKIYKDAIDWYSDDNHFSLGIRHNFDHLGFGTKRFIKFYGYCRYFWDRKIKFDELDELQALKPKKGYNYHREFWWNYNNRKIRLAKLKIALNNCINKTK